MNEIRRWRTIVESDGEHAMADAPLLYHWTTTPKAITALRSNRLQVRRWAHYLETQEKMVKGTSWSLDPWQWSRDNPICLVVARTRLSNPIHSINGNRVFLQTKGMINPLYDPRAYELEPTEPDEEFVEGTVKPLSAVLVEIRARHLAGSDLEQFRAYASNYWIPLTLLDRTGA